MKFGLNPSMLPLSLKQELSLSPETALECFISALQNEGFAVIAKISLAYDQNMEAGDKDIQQYTVIRACFPREECLVYIESRNTENLIRCSVVIQRLSEQSVAVEISRSPTLVEIDSQPRQSLKLVAEVEKKLVRISKKLHSEAALFRAS
jgi:uncharacterized protein (DUF302 family)